MPGKARGIDAATGAGRTFSRALSSNVYETDACKRYAGEGMTMSEFTLRIENMHCGSCVRRVSGLLASAARGSALEVKEVRIGAARVLSGGGSVPVQLAMDVLLKAGYPAHLEA